MPHPDPTSHRYCVAPMMDLTDRHCRRLLRLISRHARLYTEMITTQALLLGDAQRHLRHDDTEHPVAIQLGGSEPADLAACARMAADAGFDEVNLNVGCPSDRVQSGRFGACLMAEPERVADSVAAMRAAVDIEVTVKTRIGIDRDDSPDRLLRLVEQCRTAGCRIFIVHARNAWLDGLSPAENREIPPLRYAIVHALKHDNPDLQIIINGGLRSQAAIETELTHVDGVMVGREAYYNPMSLGPIDSALYGARTPVPLARDVVHAYLDHVEHELSAGTPLRAMTQHLLGLYQGVAGARAWRRTLSEEGRLRGAGIEVIERALAAVEDPGRPGPAA
jgi:tRNA-dihydrouridine synthase A